MPWLNLDIPTKQAVIHVEPCPHMGKRNKLGTSGGWRRFNTVEEAREIAEGYRIYNVKECGHCLREVLR